eukprot:1885131-Amphidinium_carterae.1
MTPPPPPMSARLSTTPLTPTIANATSLDLENLYDIQSFMADMRGAVQPTWEVSSTPAWQSLRFNAMSMPLQALETHVTASWHGVAQQCKGKK